MNDAAGPGENRAQLIRRCPGKQETLFSGVGAVRAHPHNTLRLCLCIQGLCGCPGNSAAAGTGGASPEKAPEQCSRAGGAHAVCAQPAAAGPRAPALGVGAALGGAPFGGPQGVQRTLSSHGFFLGALCSICEGKSCHFGIFRHPHIISQKVHTLLGSARQRQWALHPSDSAPRGKFLAEQHCSVWGDTA